VTTSEPATHSLIAEAHIDTVIKRHRAASSNAGTHRLPVQKRRNVVRNINDLIMLQIRTGCQQQRVMILAPGGKSWGCKYVPSISTKCNSIVNATETPRMETQAFCQKKSIILLATRSHFRGYTHIPSVIKMWQYRYWVITTSKDVDAHRLWTNDAVALSEKDWDFQGCRRAQTVREAAH